MRVRMTSIVLASALLAIPAGAQVTLDIQTPTPRPQDSNFAIAGTYGFSVVGEHPSSYRLYATGRTQRMTWFNGAVRDLKQFPPQPCPLNADPTSPGWDSRCQEQIGLYWKYIDCSEGQPCEWQGRWNAFPGTWNISAFPIGWLWPEQHPIFGVDGFTPVLTKEAANAPPICGGGVCPPSGTAVACHPDNPVGYSKGVGNGKVVEVIYPGGQKRWFMAFNTMLKTINNISSDHFRIAWAYSEDGQSWTPSSTYLFRSSLETNTDCRGYGFLMTDMFTDAGFFYLVFNELKTQNVYLARTLISPYGGGRGYVGWSWRVSGPIVSGKRTWVKFPLDGSLLDLPALGAAPIVTAGGGPKQTDINRIYVPGRSGAGLVAGVDYQYVMVNASPYGVKLWTANTLNDPFVFQSDVDTSMISRGQFGWEFAMTQFPDNIDASPRLVADELDFWVVQDRRNEDPYANVMVTRLTARLKGGIFDP